MTEPCRHEGSDEIRSFVKAITELTEARATLAKVAHLCDVATALAATKLVSSETEDAIVAFVADVRAALEPTKGTKP